MTTGARGLRLLGVARILFGTLVLLRTTPLLAPFHVAYLGSTFPLLGWPTTSWHVAAWGLGLPSSVVAALCIARTVAVLLFTLGIHARAFGAAGGLIGWIVLAQDATGYINTFNLLLLGLVVLGASGTGSAWALRAEPEIDPRSGLALTRAFVVSVYAWSGIAKLNSSWLHGEVLQQLRTSGVVRGGLSDALLSSATRCTAAAWSIAATELAIGPLLLWRRTRRPAVVAALAFHAVLQVTVHPDFFGFAMAALLLAFVARPLEDFGASARSRLPGLRAPGST
jgi:vitamin K-dependent gamma-carboxylase